MVIDFEHHYVPMELARRMGINTEIRTIVEEDGVPKANVHGHLFNLDAQIQDMDRAGIDVAVQTCILGWDTTLENCRLLNDSAAKIQREYRGRFVGLAHIPPLEGEPALKELERAVGDLELKGVTISSQARGLSLDAEEFRPFYDVVTRLQIPIFVHPALAPKGYDLLNGYQLSVILTREFDLGVAVTRLIAGGVLERYPELSLVISHFGGGLAGYKRESRARPIASSYQNPSAIISTDFILIWPASKEVPSLCVAPWKGYGLSGWCSPPIIPRTSTMTIRRRAKTSMGLANISQKFKNCRWMLELRTICWAARQRNYLRGPRPHPAQGRRRRRRPGLDRRADRRGRRGQHRHRRPGPPAVRRAGPGRRPGPQEAGPAEPGADARRAGRGPADRPGLLAAAGRAGSGGRMQLLADKLVELEVVDAVSDETVRRTLKKTRSSRG